MKKNNTFKRAIDLYKKADRLFLQHVDGFYYVSDGMSVLKISESIYNTLFAVSSIRFQMIADGETAVSDDKKALPKAGNGMDIKKIYDTTDVPYTVNKSHLTMEYVNDFDESIKARLYVVNSTIVTVNVKFAEVMDDIASVYSGYLTGKNERCPIKYDAEDGGFMMFPINSEFKAETEINSLLFALGKKAVNIVEKTA